MTIDKEIMDLFCVVNKKKQEAEEATKTIERGWVTTCQVHLPSRSTPFNIQTASVEQLLDVLAEIHSVVHNRKCAAQMLSVKYDEKFDMYTVDEWVKDIKKRIQMIESKAKKAELDKLEKRLNDIISPEQRRLLELAAIKEQLGDFAG